MPAAETPATIQGVRSRTGATSRTPPRDAPHEEQKLPLPGAPHAAQVITSGFDTMGVQSFREAMEVDNALSSGI